jgi:endogenous inhibitor of DNA gyrase (YacG/DUF329 family)
MSERRNPDGSATRVVQCPTCAGESLYHDSNPYRPFCSQRCRDIDLGSWASEDFRMQAQPEVDTDSIKLPASEQ